MNTATSGYLKETTPWYYVRSMWSKRLALLLSLIIYTTMNMLAQQDILHYYINLTANTKNEVVEKSYGKVIRNSKDKVTLTPVDSLDTNSFLQKLTTDVGSRPYDMTMYIHGMWANRPFIWRQTAEVIEDDIIGSRDTVQVIVSFIWDAAVIYQNSVDLAIKSGKSCQELFGKLTSATLGANSTIVMAHSMGNRFFQHMITPYLGSPLTRIDHYFALAADLEQNIFSKNQPLAHIGNVVREMTVYKHNNDRTLMMSQMINENSRLGLQGLDSTTLNRGGWTQVDVSLTADNQIFGKDLFNHRYYYTNPHVTTDVRLQLLGQVNPCRVAMQGCHHFKLVPNDSQ